MIVCIDANGPESIGVQIECRSEKIIDYESIGKVKVLKLVTLVYYPRTGDIHNFCAGRFESISKIGTGKTKDELNAWIKENVRL